MLIVSAGGVVRTHQPPNRRLVISRGNGLMRLNVQFSARRRVQDVFLSVQFVLPRSSDGGRSDVGVLAPTEPSLGARFLQLAAASSPPNEQPSR